MQGEGKKVEFPEHDRQARQTWEETVETQFASLLTGRERRASTRGSPRLAPLEDDGDFREDDRLEGSLSE